MPELFTLADIVSRLGLEKDTQARNRVNLFRGLFEAKGWLTKIAPNNALAITEDALAILKRLEELSSNATHAEAKATILEELGMDAQGRPLITKRVGHIEADIAGIQKQLKDFDLATFIDRTNERLDHIEKAIGRPWYARLLGLPKPKRD